jgi:uncharacterized RDD family membrane protein YckC
VETTAPTAAVADKVGFWSRVLALLIDAIGLGIISNILTRGDVTGGTGLQTLLGVIYFCYFWSSYGKGQTVGMRALNIRVVKTDGTYLDVVGAFLRYVGMVISIIPLFLGLIWVAFDAQKQGWHDKIAGTYVVRA